MSLSYYFSLPFKCFLMLPFRQISKPKKFCIAYKHESNKANKMIKFQCRAIIWWCLIFYEQFLLIAMSCALTQIISLLRSGLADLVYAGYSAYLNKSPGLRLKQDPPSLDPLAPTPAWSGRVVQRCLPHLLPSSVSFRHHEGLSSVQPPAPLPQSWILLQNIRFCGTFQWGKTGWCGGPNCPSVYSRVLSNCPQ